jgi:hypothetical protein
MYLGTIYLSTKFRLDQTSNLAALEKKQSAIITPELMAGLAPNFHHRYLISIHDIIPRFLTSTYF